jgi:cytochrome c
MFRILARVGLPAALACLGGCVPAAPPPAPAPVLAGASAERGRLLLAQYQCGSCHAIPDVPASRGTIAPPLERFGGRSYIAGRVANQPATLVQWIVAPQSLVPGTAMPSMGVTPKDARDMAAYLLSHR